MENVWVIYYKDPLDDDEPTDMCMVLGTEADVYALVCDITFQHMYEDFCFDLAFFQEHYDEEWALRHALEYKTARAYDDYGHRWHCTKIERAITF